MAYFTQALCTTCLWKRGISKFCLRSIWRDLRVNLRLFKIGREGRKIPADNDLRLVGKWNNLSLCLGGFVFLCSKKQNWLMLYRRFYPGATPNCVCNEIIYIKSGKWFVSIFLWVYEGWQRRVLDSSSPRDVVVHTSVVTSPLSPRPCRRNEL